jgi:hypothetical protein
MIYNFNINHVLMKNLYVLEVVEMVVEVLMLWVLMLWVLMLWL